jgi:hypothetical protein
MSATLRTATGTVEPRQTPTKKLASPKNNAMMWDTGSGLGCRNDTVTATVSQIQRQQVLPARRLKDACSFRSGVGDSYGFSSGTATLTDLLSRFASPGGGHQGLPS